MKILLTVLGVTMSVVPVPALQAQPDRGVAAPCRAEAAEQTIPLIGIGRMRQPRVRKEVVGAPSSAFFDAKVDGRVVVSGIVDTEGTLCDIRVVGSTHAGLGLEDTAIASAKQWLSSTTRRLTFGRGDRTRRAHRVLS